MNKILCNIRNNECFQIEAMDLVLEEMTEEMMAMTDLGGIYFMLNYFFFFRVNLCTLYILLNLDVINRSDRPRSPEGGRGM